MLIMLNDSPQKYTYTSKMIQLIKLQMSTSFFLQTALMTLIKKVKTQISNEFPFRLRIRTISAILLARVENLFVLS